MCLHYHSCLELVAQHLSAATTALTSLTQRTADTSGPGVQGGDTVKETARKKGVKSLTVMMIGMF